MAVMGWWPVKGCTWSTLAEEIFAHVQILHIATIDCKYIWPQISEVVFFTAVMKSLHAPTQKVHTRERPEVCKCSGILSKEEQRYRRCLQSPLQKQTCVPKMNCAEFNDRGKNAVLGRGIHLLSQHCGMQSVDSRRGGCAVRGPHRNEGKCVETKVRLH